MSLTRTSKGFACIGLGLLTLLVGCSNVQVDTTPNDRFAEGNYQTYSWLGAPIKNTAGSVDPLYVIDPTLQSAVDKKLASKGYRRVETGGDFQIDYQFKASIAEGALNMTATDANNQDVPVSSQDLLINRRADQALVDNAYALAGPKEVTSILLRFSDGASQNLVWAAGMSKVVDHANFDADRMSSGVNAAVNRALGRLPNAS